MQEASQRRSEWNDLGFDLKRLAGNIASGGVVRPQTERRFTVSAGSSCRREFFHGRRRWNLRASSRRTSPPSSCRQRHGVLAHPLTILHFLGSTREKINIIIRTEKNDITFFIIWFGRDKKNLKKQELIYIINQHGEPTLYINGWQSVQAFWTENTIKKLITADIECRQIFNRLKLSRRTELNSIIPGHVGSDFTCVQHVVACNRILGVWQGHLDDFGAGSFQWIGDATPSVQCITGKSRTMILLIEKKYINLYHSENHNSAKNMFRRSYRQIRG